MPQAALKPPLQPAQINITPGDRARQRTRRQVVTTIRAKCPACGDIQLTATELTVRVCSEDDRGSYWFSCPECERPVTKEASPRIIELLVSSGVRKQVWRLPAEVREPHYSGSP